MDHLRAEAATNARLAELAREEAARQAEQLRQAQHNQQHPDQQQQAPLPHPPYQQVDPALLQLMRSQDQNIAFLQQTLLQMSQTQNQQLRHNQQQVITASPPSFPVWTGNYEELELHMELLCKFKQSAYFANVHNWTIKDPRNEAESLHIRTEMLAKVPKTILPILLNDSRYADDGFAMLDRYIKVIDPDSDSNRMLALEKLVNFDLPDSKSGQQLLMEGRGLAYMLRNVDVKKLIAMFIIKTMDSAGQYPGICKAYKDGNPTVLGCTLEQLRDKVVLEGERNGIFGLPDVVPSANCGQKKPAPSNDDQPKQEVMQVAYPPARGVQWEFFRKWIKEHKQCPLCFNNDAFHWETGCPAAAREGYVLVKDQSAADKV